MIDTTPKGRGRLFALGNAVLMISILPFLLATSAARADSWMATVDWAQRLEIGPLVGGTVAATHAEVGDHLEAGSELMRIDPVPYQHEVDAAQARVESTRTDFESSRQHYERQEELYDIGSLSTVQLEDAGYALKRAESAHRLARAQLELARYNLEKTLTRAPVDAWILDKRVFVGQNLSTSQAIPVCYVVAPAGRYVASTDNLTDPAKPPAIGTDVEVEFNGTSYSGKVSFPPFHAPSGGETVTVRFSGEGLLILPGTRVTVTLKRP